MDMISIVMPVYNTGKYLDESIPAILAQSYSNFEVLCIDDASTDSLTLEKVAYYEEIDKRIILTQFPENRGAAEARNFGLKQAKGEYVIFLDADDIFNQSMLEEMYATIKAADADICVCGHRTFSDETGEIIEEVMPVELAGVTDRVFSLKDLGEDGLSYWWGVPWNKLCKMAFLKKNEIYFQTLTSCNDEFFSKMCAILAERIVYVKDGNLVSYRREGNNQISAHRPLMNVYYCMMKVIAQRDGKWSQLEKRQILYIFLTMALDVLRTDYSEEEKNVLYERVKEYIIDNKDEDAFKSTPVNMNLYIKYWSEFDYSAGWIELIGDYYTQIKQHSNELFKMIKEMNGKILVWGNGKRSQALQRFFREEKIENVYITDRNTGVLKSENMSGYDIVEKPIINQWEWIIASNKEIYLALKETIEDFSNVQLVNLEQYCPL